MGENLMKHSWLAASDSPVIILPPAIVQGHFLRSGAVADTIQVGEGVKGRVEMKSSADN